MKLLATLAALAMRSSASLNPAVDQCTCGDHECNMSHAVQYQGCWEMDSPTASQNCTEICDLWAVGTDWRQSATREPSKAVDVLAESSWKCEIPGALELDTGGGTHTTIVYFEKDERRPGWPSCSQVVSESLAYAREQGVGTVHPFDALTFMWGCGSSCTSSAALVDVSSPLAALKYGLMAHFEASGLPVDVSLWGATAHIQTVW